MLLKSGVVLYRCFWRVLMSILCLVMHVLCVYVLKTAICFFVAFFETRSVFFGGKTLATLGPTASVFGRRPSRSVRSKPVTGEKGFFLRSFCTLSLCALLFEWHIKNIFSRRQTISFRLQSQLEIFHLGNASKRRELLARTQIHHQLDIPGLGIICGFNVYFFV